LEAYPKIHEADPGGLGACPQKTAYTVYMIESLILKFEAVSVCFTVGLIGKAMQGDCGDGWRKSQLSGAVQHQQHREASYRRDFGERVHARELVINY
jgi:hypothetical protein